jgi:nucleoside-diphosphate-sugar epimerase
VTGATGFIGSHLIEQLVGEGWQVRAAVRPTSNCDLLRERGVGLCVDALADPRALRAALEGANVVFHLAGQISPRWRDELTRTNALATARLAEVCGELARPPIVVACSSLAAAGPSPAERPRRLHHPAVPISAYGRSKRAGEVAFEKVAGHVPVTIVRPGIVFGPRGKELLPVWRSIARFRTHLALGVFPPKLSLVWVHDLTRWLIAAAHRGQRLLGGGAADGERGYYFASAEESITYTQLGWAIAKSLGVNPAMIHIPEPFAFALAGVAELFSGVVHLPDQINADKMREGLVSSWEVDASPTYRDLGGPPEKPLRERIAELTAWYQRADWL